MRQRNKRNIVIGILCVMVVFMSVGYAVLSQNLNINGTANITGSWKIEITSITPEEINEGKSVSTNIEDSKVAGSFVANLKKPTDAVVYTVTVENKGTIDAVLESITPEDYTEGDIKYTTTGKENCKNLDAESSCDFTIKVEYLDTGVGQVPTPNGTEVKQEFTIKYVQEGANVNTPGGGSSGGEIDNTPAITVDSNGLVTGYNKEKLTNDEGYVVIPATTEDGEEIVSIDASSFAEYNMSVAYIYNEVTDEEIEAIVIYDEENYDAIEDCLLLMFGGEAAATGTSSKFNRNINPTNLTGNKYKNPTLQKLATNTADGLTIYSQTEFDALLKEIESTGSLEIEYEKIYLDYTAEDPEEAVKQPIATIEKLDLTEATNLKIIEENAFAYSKLKEIKLGNTIEEIGDYAFSGSQLKIINLPNSLKTIGEAIFPVDTEITRIEINMEIVPSYLLRASWGNLLVENLIIPSKVKTIEENAIQNDKLSSGDGHVEIKNLFIDMEEIPQKRFNGISIEKVTIGTNVKTIGTELTGAGGSVFTGCDISSLVFEENSKVTTIGHNSFDKNQIKQLSIPDSVRTIGYNAFANNQISGTLVIPNSVKELSGFGDNQISDIVFEAGSTLTEIKGFSGNLLTKLPELPQTVTSIGAEAFTNCQISGEVVIPARITNIGGNAFWNNKITTLIFENTYDNPSQLTIIGEDAFHNNQISGELVIPSSVTRIVGSLYTGTFAYNQITSVIFEDTEDKPSQLTSIGTGAFSNNDLRGNIVIPSSVTTISGPYTIAPGAFGNNPNLSTITIKRQNSDGMTLEAGWNGTAQVVFDPNYVG